LLANHGQHLEDPPKPRLLLLQHHLTNESAGLFSQH
jgi:hypothetical protein